MQAAFDRDPIRFQRPAWPPRALELAPELPWEPELPCDGALPPYEPELCEDGAE
jgi:hypothetical protein